MPHLCINQDLVFGVFFLKVSHGWSQLIWKNCFDIRTRYTQSESEIGSLWELCLNAQTHSFHIVEGRTRLSTADLTEIVYRM